MVIRGYGSGSGYRWFPVLDHLPHPLPGRQSPFAFRLSPFAFRLSERRADANTVVLLFPFSPLSPFFPFVPPFPFPPPFLRLAPPRLVSSCLVLSCHGELTGRLLAQGRALNPTAYSAQPQRQQRLGLGNAAHRARIAIIIKLKALNTAQFLLLDSSSSKYLKRSQQQNTGGAGSALKNLLRQGSRERSFTTTST